MKIFYLQDKIDNIIFDFGFKYGHTLDSYDHCYYKDEWMLIFNPDETTFQLSNNLKQINVVLSGNDDIILEKVKDTLNYTKNNL